MHPRRVSANLSRALGPGHQRSPTQAPLSATRTDQGTGDLRAVQILLGHASPTTTAVYTQFADAALVYAVLAAG
jgi:integrase/recombinase XerD